MSCSDKKINDLIFDFVDGSLGDLQKIKVEQHLKQCSECQNLLGEYQRIITELEPVLAGFVKEHASNESLLTYIDNPEKLQKTEKEGIALHLEICESCQKKAKMLSNISLEEKEFSEESENHSFLDSVKNIIDIFTAKPVLSFASAAIVILIALPLGFYINSQLSESFQLEFSQSAKVTWLQEQVRNGQIIPEIIPEDGLLKYGIYYEPYFSDEKYVLFLKTANNEEIYKTELTQNDFSNNIELLILIKDDNISSGEYNFVIISYDLKDGKELTRTNFPFMIK